MTGPNDAPMYLRYIRLEKIREAFAARYAHWGFNLPEIILPSGSPLNNDDFSG
jgi:bacteriorhodopsin